MKIERYSSQFIDADDLKAVEEVLKSDWLTQGPSVTKFEADLVQRIEKNFKCAVVNSATSALQLAYNALGVGKDDLVLTSPITFAATANAALYNGAKVALSDVDRVSGCMCPKSLERTIIKLAAISKKPKVVTMVHMGGTSYKEEEIFDICEHFDITVMEDASHALGANYDSGNKVGSNSRSAGAVFSFHPVKMITTGEGGAFVSENNELIEKITSLRSHSTMRANENSLRPWEYDIFNLGYNCRISDLNAALGSSQLKKLDQFIKVRREIAKRYVNSELSNFCEFAQGDYLNSSSFHLFQILLKDDFERTALFNHLITKNIGVNVHYRPLSSFSYLRDNDRLVYSSNKNADMHYSQVLSIPNHFNLDFDEVDYVIKVICDFLHNARK